MELSIRKVMKVLILTILFIVIWCATLYCGYTDRWELALPGVIITVILRIIVEKDLGII